MAATGTTPDDWKIRTACHCAVRAFRMGWRLGGFSRRLRVSDIGDRHSRNGTKPRMPDAVLFMTKAALPPLGEGSAIVNTTSVTADQGNPSLVDDASAKGPSSPSPAACPSSWPATGSGATRSPPGRSGRR